MMWRRAATHRRYRAVFIALASVVSLAAAAETARATDPAATCTLKKRIAASKKAKLTLQCVGNAVRRAAAVDQPCLEKAENKFTTIFAKAELPGACAVTDDLVAVEEAMEVCLGVVRSLLGVPDDSPAPLSKCTAIELKAAGKKLASKIECWHKVLKRAAPVSPICLGKAETTFDALFGKAQKKADCLTGADALTVEAAVDVCLDDLLAVLPPPTTTTTTTTTTSSSMPPEPCVSDPEPAAFVGTTAAHNDVRANASPTPDPPLNALCWDSGLEAIAQSHANGCVFVHSDAPGLGENLYAIAGDEATAPILAVELWASEAADYDYNTDTCADQCGHYTQLVWRGTETVGCGMKVCSTGSPLATSDPTWTFVVCNYDPTGNIVGQLPY